MITTTPSAPAGTAPTAAVRTAPALVRLAAPFIACLVAFCALLGVAGASSASAHPLSTTAILLDVGAEQVSGQVQLPIDRLAIALDEPLTAESVSEPQQLQQLQQYVDDHTSAAGTDGQVWEVQVGGGRVQTIDAVDHLVLDLALIPADGTVGDVVLTYDAVVEHLLSHRVFVSVRGQGEQDYTNAGLLDWSVHSVTVPAGDAGTSTGLSTGFTASLRLGFDHITKGADHLIFLLMLLLPAPLLARRGRWVPGGQLRRDVVKVVHVVTAFAVGHSITLALGALGWVELPSRLVENAIAVSILVSAVHALRPLVRGGEAWIAAGFGLMHGLAFATLVQDLGLGRGSLLADLLGFNFGIELTQLAVVGLVMPSLLGLARTRVYPAVRVTAAVVGLVLASAWLAERTTLTGSNPLEGVSDVLVHHPLALAAALATSAALTWLTPGLRTTASPAPTPRSTRGQAPRTMTHDSIAMPTPAAHPNERATAR